MTFAPLRVPGASGVPAGHAEVPHAGQSPSLTNPGGPVKPGGPVLPDEDCPGPPVHDPDQKKPLHMNTTSRVKTK